MSHIVYNRAREIAVEYRVNVEEVKDKTQGERPCHRLSLRFLGTILIFRHALSYVTVLEILLRRVSD